uniref:Innexin n=1 Tax=Ditylenchus dipsaci TaxID=166011 RepID=A0A915DHV4_9BILA
MIEALISMIRYLSARQDDDIVDRMNYLYTPNMLLAFSVLISFKQFGGRPLECMFPNKFPGKVHVATINANERYSAERKLSYYQWVPFFLLLQAACFRFPSFLWKCLSLSSGIQVHDIVSRAMDPGNLDTPTRQKNIETLANHISRALNFQQQISRRRRIVHRTKRLLNLSYSACFISYMYLVTKILYLSNVVMQLYLMNKFLGTDRHQWYGFGVIVDIMKGVPWESSGYFPRVSLCDFTVRQVANIQKYSVQCVLVINIFNEKIFILLWFWYSIMLLASIVSLLYWLVLMAFPCFGRWYVVQNLELNEMEDINTLKYKKEINKFVNEYLKQDGVFVLRMVSMHAGVLFSTELIMRLYKIFYGLDDSDANNSLKKTANNNSIAAHHHSVNANNTVEDNNRTEYLRQRHNKKKQKKQSLTKSAGSGLGSNLGSGLDLTTTLIPVAQVASGNQAGSSSSSSSSSDNDQKNALDDDDDDKATQKV